MCDNDSAAGKRGTSSTILRMLRTSLRQGMTMETFMRRSAVILGSGQAGGKRKVGTVVA